LDGGKDAAAGRYIFTRLEKYMKYLFREEDEPLYTYVNVDGDIVEPVCYMPILPMILVNGCSGIGTGWSSDIPCFNPVDLIEWITTWLDQLGNDEEEKEEIEVVRFPKLVPWYKGFKGEITLDATNSERFITHGCFKESAKKKDGYEITELPIGVWTEKYKNQVEDWYEAKQISYRANYSTIDNVNFVIVPEEKMEMTEKNLKLTSYLSTSNMVAFSMENKIHKYKNAEEILQEYCKTRLDMYGKRREYQLSQVTHQIRTVKNKIRFLQEVMGDDLVLFKKTDGWVQEELTKRKYDKEDESYSYLLHMSIQSFTSEKLEELMKQRDMLVEKHKKIVESKPNEIWKQELSELQRALK
jgi:DNA topoisomerase-2